MVCKGTQPYSTGKGSHLSCSCEPVAGSCLPYLPASVRSDCEAPESNISTPIPHKPCLQLHTPPQWLLEGSDQWISLYVSVSTNHAVSTALRFHKVTHTCSLLLPVPVCFWAEKWVTSSRGDAIQPQGKVRLHLEKGPCRLWGWQFVTTY